MRLFSWCLMTTIKDRQAPILAVCLFVHLGNSQLRAVRSKNAKITHFTLKSSLLLWAEKKYSGSFNFFIFMYILCLASRCGDELENHGRYERRNHSKTGKISTYNHSYDGPKHDLGVLEPTWVPRVKCIMRH